MPIVSWTWDSVTVEYVGEASQIRYNFYTAPCEPGAGILLCAVYSQAEQLPAAPFIMNVSVP